LSTCYAWTILNPSVPFNSLKSFPSTSFIWQNRGCRRITGISMAIEGRTSEVNTSDSIGTRIRIAQTRLVIDNISTNVVAALVVATIVTLIIFRYRTEPSRFVFIWLVVFACFTICRYIYAKRCKHTRLTGANINHVLNITGLFMFLSGAWWGVLGYSYIDADYPVISMILLMVFTGMAANCAATMSYVLPLYLVFVYPMMLLAALKFYLIDHAQYQWVPVLIFIYLFFSSITTRRIRTSLKQSILLRFENLDLIDDLQIQNEKTESALKKAEQANLAKSRFFAAASHDLRQPLQSLGMFTTSLESQVDKPQQKKVVSHIASSVRSLEGLFNALLDISSLDAETIKVRKQHFYLDSQIGQMVTDLKELATDKHLSLVNDVGSHPVYCDPILLNRIIRNLSDNALNYTQKGEIKISSEQRADKVVLTISDTGLGIAEHDAKHIFEEFVQLNNPERDRSKGLGLGLSIVMRICELLDLDLDLKSTVGVGSSFSISLDVGDESKISNKAIQQAELPGSLNGLFVLVVDDEEDVRLSMESLLGVWDCTVMLASSGAEATLQLSEYGSCPDVVITDYRLRNNETGAEALALINKTCEREVPAIVITGDIAPQRLVEIDKLNLPVLHKPCNTVRLKGLLSSIQSSMTD